MTITELVKDIENEARELGLLLEKDPYDYLGKSYPDSFLSEKEQELPSKENI